MGKSVARVTKPTPIPPLRDGDRMNAREFMRRYEATPEGFRAELINGVVYVNRWVEYGPNREVRVMPPIGGGGHGDPQGDIIATFGVYAAATPGVRASAPTTIVLSAPDAAPEPDALLRILPEFGGRAELGPDDYLHGPPELVVEIANTSAGQDLGPKFKMYERYEFPEYLVWRTRERLIDLFRRNRAGRYVIVPPDEDKVIRSRAFPGLWLDVEALLSSNVARVFAVVQQGLASPEHATFVEKLRKAAARKKRS